jgi:hypothetical protein
MNKNENINQLIIEAIRKHPSASLVVEYDMNNQIRGAVYDSVQNALYLTDSPFYVVDMLENDREERGLIIIYLPTL